MPLRSLAPPLSVPTSWSAWTRLKDDVVKFLKTAPAIKSLNFGFPKLRVYPGTYSKVADAIDRDDIRIHTTSLSPIGVYHPDTDSLDFGVSFNMGNWRDQAFLIHESTHAYIDYLDLGQVSNHENEALAYVAEAVFLEASGKSPLGTEDIRVVSHRIAKGILAGTYWVSPSDVIELENEIAKHPVYSSTVIYNSNGFHRKGLQKLLH